MTDPDLLAVRDLPPGAPQPTDESVSRTWYLLSARQTARQTRRSRPLLRWLVPITAAALVGVVTVGVITYRDSGVDFAAPQIGLIAASHQPLPTEHATHDPSLTKTTPEAIAALEALAHTAEQGTGVVTLEPGQLIHVDIVGWAASWNEAGSGTPGTVKYQPRSIWLDPEGMIALKLLAGERDMFAGPRANPEGNIAHARQYLAEHGPEIGFPTPQWLAGLPADPQQLLAALRAEVRDNRTWSKDHMVWDAMGQLYSTCDILLTPAQRAALLRAFTGLDGLTAGEVQVDGTRLIAIRQSDQTAAYEILFDPVTAWAVGRRSVSLDPSSILTPIGTGPVFDPPVDYHATWTQTIVNSLDES